MVITLEEDVQQRYQSIRSFVCYGVSYMSVEALVCLRDSLSFFLDPRCRIQASLGKSLTLTTTSSDLTTSLSVGISSIYYAHL